MKSGPRKVSIKDVAQAAGVSIASVSRVMNKGSGTVSEATRAKVEKAIADLNYRPNWIGQALRGQASNTFAMVISSIQNNFYSAVAWEIERRLNDQSAAMLLFNSNENVQLQDRCLDEIRSRQVAGVFMLCAVDSPNLKTLAQQTPTLFINRRLETMPEVPFIGIDDRSAAIELAKAITHGLAGPVALIHGPQSSATSRARFEGFCAEFERAGHPIEARHMSEAELSMESGYACAVQLLSQSGVPYSAIVCGNDQIAYGAYRRCRELGLSVPQDIAIYGFDDNPLNHWLAPWLNTVSVPHKRYAETAVDNMMRMVEGQSVGDTILPYNLILRH